MREGCITKEQGFTLIELLVVIAIIGVLSSVVIAALNNSRAKARDARATMELKQIETAAMLDYNDNGGYAPDVSPGVAPRFMPTYMSAYNASYYCSTCVYDWQNWGTSCIIIDLYQTGTGPVLRRRCIDTAGCACGNI